MVSVEFGSGCEQYKIAGRGVEKIQKEGVKSSHLSMSKKCLPVVNDDSGVLCLMACRKIFAGCSATAIVLFYFNFAFKIRHVLCVLTDSLDIT